MMPAETRGSKNSLPRSRWLTRSAVLLVPLLVAAAITFSMLRTDLFANQKTSTAGVVREASIQRQYALALLENDLKHWNAVAEYFPPTDAISRNYQLKSDLQIARLKIDGEDFSGAEMCLRRVINSQYADDVLRTIARMELGWVTGRGKRDAMSNEHYDRAMRDFSIMVPDKQRLIRDALPAKVRTEWENIDYLHKGSHQQESDP
jgi:predicted negative regulator of RcsB-dependent stress response